MYFARYSVILPFNAVGGPGVSTNEAAAGLLDSRTVTMLVPYPIPMLSFSFYKNKLSVKK